MADKGLDYTFVHHGIRQDDMKILESLAKDFVINDEWLIQLLNSYHDKKTRNPEIDDKEVTRLLEDHLNKI